MLRKNGKPTSCEPCRIAKVRCDHSIPTCRRCKSKGISSKCYYHPAPLTKTRTPDETTSSPKTPVRRRYKRRVLPIRDDETIAAQSLAEVRKKTAIPAPVTNRKRNNLGYLGKTSYLSVFNDDPSSFQRAPWHCSLQTEFEHWRSNHAYTCARLVHLLCAIGFHREQISWYFDRSRLSKLSAPLILEPLRLVQEHIEKNAWNEEQDWKTIYDQITAATSPSLKFTSDTTPAEFYSLFTGENLRWEFVGFIFAMAGNSVDRRYKETHLIDLGNGEKMKAGTFIKEMLLASNACIEICRQYERVNDLMIWLYQNHIMLASEVLGETSERLYSLFGDMVSEIYAMGLHRCISTNVPFFLSETRKRVLATIHKSDKNMATLFGRPPRLPFRYCDFTLPLDLSDDHLFLTGQPLQTVLSGLDSEGWNCQAQFYPATVIRMRHIISTLGEKMLELSLGSKASSYHDDVLSYELCQKTWDQIPLRFHYSAKCWEEGDVTDSLAKALVYLEYLMSVFQIQRVRRQEDPRTIKYLLDTSVQLLSVTVDLTKYYEHPEVRRNFGWLFLAFGSPPAGLLLTELRRYTLLNQAFPSSSPRSQVIRTLTYLISWLQSVKMPSAVIAAPCKEVTKVMSCLLDETLDYQPLQYTSSLTMPVEFPGMETTNLTAANNDNISQNHNSLTLEQHDRETHIQLSDRQRGSGVLEGRTSTELPWLGVGMDFGDGDDAFYGLGRALMSDGRNWFDELGLNADPDDNAGAVGP